jgi:hypothetical protein
MEKARARQFKQCIKLIILVFPVADEQAEAFQ